MTRRPLEVEIYVDSFAGGGGASEGMRRALGRGPDIAINHDAEAIALHAANHPESEHYQEDVWKVDPVKACAGRKVGLMWLSPDCKHFSKAKGGKPVSPRVRGLAWVAVRWAKAVKPRILVLENVEEFQTWGPLLNDRPDPARKGRTFNMFVGRLRGLGYQVEWRELRACDFGAPTIRKRLFLVARCDGQAIVWPRATHGKGTTQPWRTAAECIDFSLPCPSIFTRKKPLADNTLKRIGAGLHRFVLEADRPFIVNMSHGGSVEALNAPMTTVKTERGGCRALITPVLAPHYGASLCAAFLAKHQSERHANEVQAASLFDCVPTVKTRDSHALVTSSLVSLRGTEPSHLHGDSLEAPMRTVSAGGLHTAEVRAFLVSYYSTQQRPDLFAPMPTVTTRDRIGLVTVEGHDYQIVDIGMRMLAPRELYTAQGFDASYQIDIPFTSYYTKQGKLRKKPKTAPMTKEAQVRMVGNSVCPDVAKAIISANVERVSVEVRAA